MKSDRGNEVSKQLAVLGLNLVEISNKFPARSLTVLATLYQSLDDGLTGKDVEALLNAPQSTATRIAQRLSNKCTINGSDIYLCSYNHEEGMGNFKTLRFTTEGLRWYEDNVLAVFLNT